MDSKKTKILLVEDHVVVRKGLKALLEFESDFKVVGEADNGIDAIKLTKKIKPDLVVMDLAMPKLNGIEASKQILAKDPSVKILVLSAHGEDGYIEKVINLGVSGYLMKRCSPRLLVEAIRIVLTGKNFYGPAIESRLKVLKNFRNFDSGGASCSKALLSPREAEVLQMVAEGKSNKVIAFELGISIKTVEKHRQSLMNKLAIHDTAGLTRYAISEGVVSGDSMTSIDEMG